MKMLTDQRIKGDHKIKSHSVYLLIYFKNNETLIWKDYVLDFKDDAIFTNTFIATDSK